MAARPALAQSTITGGRGTPLVPDADTVPPTHFTTSLGASYTATPRGPFQLSPAGVTFGFSNRLDVGLALRSWSPSDVEARGASIDPQLTLKLRLLSESLRRPGLALSVAVDHFFQGRDVSPALILHKNRGPLLLTAQLGYRFPLHGGVADPAGLFAGAAMNYWWSASFSLYVQAVGESGPDRHVWLMPGLAWSLLGPDPYEKVRESLREKAKQSVAALESELGVKIASLTRDAAPASEQPSSTPLFARGAPSLGAPGRVTFFVTGGPAFGAGPGWRALGGIQISTFDEFLQDSDGDGIPDRVDRCPFEPEDWDGYQDGDGCPDHGAEVLRKLAEEHLAKTEAEAAKLTTPTPRFRMRIPVSEIPDPNAPQRDTAPMYERLAPQSATPPPVPPPPPPPSAPTPSGTTHPPESAAPAKATRARAMSAAPASSPATATAVAVVARAAQAPSATVAPATTGPATTAPTSAAPASIPPTDAAATLPSAAIAPTVVAVGTAPAPTPAAQTPRAPSVPVPARTGASTRAQAAAIGRAVAPAPAVTVSVVVLPPSTVVARRAPTIRVSGGAFSGPALSVGRELAAMASVQFADPDAPLSDEDEEAILRVVRLGVAEGDEVLVWARAREPWLLSEATRRADAILELAAREGAAVVTRVTTPGASEVELEVSATRVQLRGAEAVAPQGDDAAFKRVREAALRYRPAIARCLERGASGAERRAGEAVVRLAIDPGGGVAAALRHDSPLWQPSVDACLAARAREWRFPPSDAGYVIDVPVRRVVKKAVPQ